MAIPDDKINLFDSMRAAVSEERLALLECVDKRTHATVYVICIMKADATTVSAYPIAQMFDGDPTEHLEAPGEPLIIGDETPISEGN